LGVRDAYSNDNKNVWVFLTIFCKPGVALYNSARDVGLLEIIDNLYIEKSGIGKKLTVTGLGTPGER
jgi:hypothetical protein